METRNLTGSHSSKEKTPRFKVFSQVCVLHYLLLTGIISIQIYTLHGLWFILWYTGQNLEPHLELQTSFNFLFCQEQCEKSLKSSSLSTCIKWDMWKHFIKGKLLLFSFLLVKLTVPRNCSWWYGNVRIRLDRLHARQVLYLSA